MRTRRPSPAPTSDRLASTLGPALEIWNAVTDALDARYGPLDREWKPSKSAFGLVCLLKRKDRTLLYMTPEKDDALLAVVLGERAVATALAADLPAPIKKLIEEARPYAEGRGVRFPVRCVRDLPVVLTLVDAKMSPTAQRPA